MSSSTDLDSSMPLDTQKNPQTYSRLPIEDEVDVETTRSRSDSNVDETGSHRHAPVANASWMTAGQLMVADIVGVGVLSLPGAMATLGWFMGTFFIILFFPLNIYTGLLLWKVKLDKPSSISFYDMGKVRGGLRLAQFSGFVVYLHIWLTLGDYLLVLGEALGLIFFDSYICKREWVLIGCICILPFCQLRYLNDTKWLCWINMATITCAIIISLGYMIGLGTEETLTAGNEPEVIPDHLDIFVFMTAFSKIAFAYAGQFLYLEIMAEMKEPKEFPKSFFLAGPYQLGMYLIAACVGYHYKGKDARGLMINWIPYNPWIRLAAIFLFLHMIVTYLIKANVMGRAVHRVLSPKRLNDTSWRGKMEWFGVTVLVMTSCILVAESIPFFESLTGLIGALLVPIACWNLPIIYYVLDSKKPIRAIEMPLLVIIFALGVLLTCVGTYSNMKDIVGHWEEYGPPFSCGCEGVWNTCECSATHTGMQCS